MLSITFVSGRAHAYQGVPVDVAQGLRLALVKGEDFNTASIGSWPNPSRREPAPRSDRFSKVRRVAYWADGEAGPCVRPLAPRPADL